MKNLRWLRLRRPTYAEVAATLALLICTSGTAYAAVVVTTVEIKDNTILSKDLSDGGVRSVDIKDGTVGLADIADTTEAQLRGQSGTNGTNGADGKDGMAVAFGYVEANGVVRPELSLKLDSTMVTQGTIQGLYCFHDVPFAFKNLQVTPAASNTGFMATAPGLGVSSGCDAVQGTQFQVWIQHGWSPFFVTFN